MPFSKKVAPEPSYTSWLWQWWKTLGKKIGNFQARVVLSLFYFLLLPPLSMALRFLSDPLRLRTEGNSFWLLRSSHHKQELEDARRQF